MIREKRDILAFKRITNEGRDASACPISNRSAFKITQVIIDVSSMGVLEVIVS